MGVASKILRALHAQGYNRTLLQEILDPPLDVQPEPVFCCNWCSWIEPSRLTLDVHVSPPPGHSGSAQYNILLEFSTSLFPVYPY